MRIKPIIRLEDHKEYEAIADAKKDFPELCVSALRSHRKCGNWHWCYKEDYIEGMESFLSEIDIENKYYHYRNNSERIINLSKSRIFNSIKEACDYTGLTRYKLLKNIRKLAPIKGDLYTFLKDLSEKEFPYVPEVKVQKR